MNIQKFAEAKIVSSDGRSHHFDSIKDFQVNVKYIMLSIKLEDGEFNLPLDRLRYFEVALNSQKAEIRFPQFEIFLVPHNGKPSESVRISDVVSYDWKINYGLLMVFSVNCTAGFHLDHVISFSASQK
jgi:hypothetical protein